MPTAPHTSTFNTNDVSGLGCMTVPTRLVAIILQPFPLLPLFCVQRLHISLPSMFHLRITFWNNESLIHILLGFSDGVSVHHTVSNPPPTPKKKVCGCHSYRRCGVALEYYVNCAIWKGPRLMQFEWRLSPHDISAAVRASGLSLPSWSTSRDRWVFVKRGPIQN
jgi:hypothetical protein